MSVWCQDMSAIKISVLTCGSGDQLYSTFGHSAVRIKNTLTDQDYVYNYGTFDFDEPNFYLKFLRGKLNYKLAVSSFASFMREYEYFKRWVIEQDLNLSDEQKLKIVNFLKNNSQPENRDYKYDFFFDNCSTRIRDFLNSEIGVIFDDSQINKSYRDLLDEDLKAMPWSDFGIDIVIGAVADQRIDYSSQMFIPDYLMKQIGLAEISGEELVRETRTLITYPEVDKSRQESPWFSPLLVLCLLLLVELFFLYKFITKPIQAPRFYDLLIAAVTGFIGLIILFLWFFTNHGATKSNLNLFWLSPLYLFSVKGIITRKSTFYLHRLLILPSFICLGLWAIMPQSFHMAFMPWMLVLMSFNFRHAAISRFKGYSK